VGLLAGAELLGQQGAVEELVRGMDAPEEVKEAELRIATLESHLPVGDEARPVACLEQQC
jgi:hypothetical protein